MKFNKLDPVDDLQSFIRQHFDIDLPVKGGWGYDADAPVVVLPHPTLPKNQIEQIFATILANIEMNLMFEKGEGFSGINVKEISRNEMGEIERVEYEITAMPEKRYADFIEEYKEGYGKDDFDLEDHFRRRDAETIRRVINLYFKVERPSV